MNDSRLDMVKDNIRGVWDNIVQILSRTKELALEMTDPSILSEQLRIIFRDESKLRMHFCLLFIYADK